MREIIFEKGDFPLYLPQKVFPEVSVEKFSPNYVKSLGNFASRKSLTHRFQPLLKVICVHRFQHGAKAKKISTADLMTVVRVQPITLLSHS